MRDVATPVGAASDARPHVRAGARLLVLSGLFPAPPQMPVAGTFIRERMFRVGRFLPVVVVAPQPWFPLQRLIRRFLPHFRPALATYEVQDGFEIHRPRFLSVPMYFKPFDGLFMALATYRLARRLVRKHGINVLDAHFGFPEGHAASLLGRWLGLPVVLTLRGKEERQTEMPVRDNLRRAVLAANRVVCVSDALRNVALSLGASPDTTCVIGNGVDDRKFHRVDRGVARARFGLPADVPVLVSVGTLVERKGFHRVLAVLPELIKRRGDVRFLIVGGPGAEGDYSATIRALVRDLGLDAHVVFTGALAPEELSVAYSAADVFTLASSYEGWANVLLEAMACGLPVVTTDVGGNAQVVNNPTLGTVVPFGEPRRLLDALDEAIGREWDRDAIVQYARANGWSERIERLVALFGDLVAAPVRK